MSGLLFYSGWFFSNRIVMDPALWYADFFRLLGVLIFSVGIGCALHAWRRPGLYAKVLVLLTLLLCIFHVRLMVLDIVRIDGHSMEPTLKDGDRILVERWSSGLHLPPLDFPFSILPIVAKESDPGPPRSRTLGSGYLPFRRGDIVVFDYPERRMIGRFFIKRIAGLPGEQYHFTEHRLFIEGEVFLGPDGNMAVIDSYPTKHQNPVINPPDYLNDLSTTFLYSAMNGIGDSGSIPAEGYLLIGDNYRQSRDSRVIGFIPISAVQGRRWTDMVF